MFSRKYSVSVEPNVRQCVHERPSEVAILRKSNTEEFVEICSCKKCHYYYYYYYFCSLKSTYFVMSPENSNKKCELDCLSPPCLLPARHLLLPPI